MIVAGIMSGTSADGINVAIAQLLGRGFATRLRLIAHEEFPYPARVRSALLGLMNAQRADVADLARMNFLLAELYAAAVQQTQRRSRVARIDLIGCHGQTIYHQGDPREFLGRRLAVTWQLGEGSTLAERVGAPVVSDFRPADMAAGGKGAPLVPLLDYVVFRHRARGRILQNIGGIANLSTIPASARPSDVIAFDTGPGNMVIDGCMERLFQRGFDRDGKVAARGKVITPALKVLVQDPFFRRRPPKTAGREEFGREFVGRFIRLCGRAKKEDVIATATAFTVETIRIALRSVVTSKGKFRDYIVTGGGAKNPTLMRMLDDELPRLDLTRKSSDDLGVPPAAKEAMAFALLAYQTWHRQPGNVPSATGARRPAILGKISYV